MGWGVVAERSGDDERSKGSRTEYGTTARCGATSLLRGLRWLGDGQRSAGDVLSRVRADGRYPAGAQRDRGELGEACGSSLDGRALDAPLAGLAALGTGCGAGEVLAGVTVQSVLNVAQACPTSVAPQARSAGDAQGGRPATNVSAVRAVVCRAEFTWDCAWAVRVVFCESGGDPAAVGDEWYRGEHYAFIGWWQIAVPYDAWQRGEYEWLTDPVLNTVEAHLKYLASGTSPWPVCRR